MCFMMIFLFHINAVNGICAMRAVSFFFILSGFGMAYSQFEKITDLNISNFCDYLKNKIKKFYPLHFITFLISLPLTPFIINIYNGQLAGIIYYSKYAVLNLLLLQSFWPQNYFFYNGVSWFLSTILCIFALSPLIFKMLKYIFKNNKYIVVSFIMLIGIICAYDYFIYKIKLNSEFWSYIFPLARIGEFTIGAYIALLYPEIKKVCENTIKFPVLVNTLFEIIVIYLFFKSLNFAYPFIVPDAFMRNLIQVPFNVILILVLSISNGIVVNILQNQVLVYLGNISMVLFLFHQIIISYYNLYSLPQEMIYKFSICLAVTIILSIIYKYLSTRIRIYKEARYIDKLKSA